MANFTEKAPTTTMTLESGTGFPMALRNIMRGVDLEGEVVYKGFAYMKDGQEVWFVQAHLYKNKEDDTKEKGYHIFCSTAHHPSFYDSCKSAAWNAIDTLGIVLNARLRVMQDRLKEVERELETIKKRKTGSMKKYLAQFK